MKHKLQKQIHPVLGHILHRMKQISHRIYEDKVTVYAAQASFFVVFHGESPFRSTKYTQRHAPDDTRSEFFVV